MVDERWHQVIYGFKSIVRIKKRKKSKKKVGEKTKENFDGCILLGSDQT